jgi:hypothetical protein
MSSFSLLKNILKLFVFLFATIVLFPQLSGDVKAFEQTEEEPLVEPKLIIKLLFQTCF